MRVETIAANSGRMITSDTLSFDVRDEVGSVIATVTESLGGANQTVALSSYDAWGKARATSGGTAYQNHRRERSTAPRRPPWWLPPKLAGQICQKTHDPKNSS